MEEAGPCLKHLQVFEKTSHSPCPGLVFSLGVGKIVQSHALTEETGLLGKRKWTVCLGSEVNTVSPEMPSKFSAYP